MSQPDLSDAPRGLGGWLVLVGIGVVFGPLRLIFILLTLHLPFFQDGTYTSLTDPGSPYYHPYWKPFILFEIGGNLLILGLCIWLVYLFFSKHRRFPKVFIFVQIFSPAFIVSDTFGVTLILPDIEALDPETARELISSVIGAMIWVPYMLVSKRVKATFVEGGPANADDDIVSRF